jgi:carbon monoxide dehydrogenase subunit G
MEISQSFTVARPLPAVWSLFQDVPEVAGCMPGAELLEDKGNGVYSGRVGVRLGPFTASFEGDAQVTVNAADNSGHVEGKGTDRRGGSRSKLVLDYRLTPAGSGTKVDIKADMQLVGPVAQFGRTGIITETANILIGQFVQNVEAKLAATPAAAPAAAASASTSASSSASATATASATASTSPRPAPAAPLANEISALTLLRGLIVSFFRRLFGGKQPGR